MELNKEKTLEEKVEAIYGKDATEDQIAFLAENPDAYDYDDTDDDDESTILLVDKATNKQKRRFKMTNEERLTKITTGYASDVIYFLRNRSYKVAETEDLLERMLKNLDILTETIQDINYLISVGIAMTDTSDMKIVSANSLGIVKWFSYDDVIKNIVVEVSNGNDVSDLQKRKWYNMSSSERLLFVAEIRVKQQKMEIKDTERWKEFLQEEVA